MPCSSEGCFSMYVTEHLISSGLNYWGFIFLHTKNGGWCPLTLAWQLTMWCSLPEFSWPFLHGVRMVAPALGITSVWGAARGGTDRASLFILPGKQKASWNISLHFSGNWKPSWQPGSPAARKTCPSVCCPHGHPYLEGGLWGCDWTSPASDRGGGRGKELGSRCWVCSQQCLWNLFWPKGKDILLLVSSFCGEYIYRLSTGVTSVPTRSCLSLRVQDVSLMYSFLRQVWL